MKLEILGDVLPFVDSAASRRNCVTDSEFVGVIRIETSFAVFRVEKTHGVHRCIEWIEFVDKHYLEHVVSTKQHSLKVAEGMTNLNHISNFTSQNGSIESKPIRLLTVLCKIGASVPFIQGFVIGRADAGI
jgi:hypothetical protein